MKHGGGHGGGKDYSGAFRIEFAWMEIKDFAGMDGMVVHCCPRFLLYFSFSPMYLVRVHGNVYL